MAKGQWHDAIHFNALAPLGFLMLFSLFWNHRWRQGLWSGGLSLFAAYGLVRLFVPGI